MRLGLDLRTVADPDRRRSLAIEADRLGLWAVLIGAGGAAAGGGGSPAIEAAALATATDHLHLALWFAADDPLSIAEEVAIVDHLSQRRALAVVDGRPEAVERVDQYLGGRIIDGVALTPPPAQTRVPVWSVEQAETVELSGDLAQDRATIDERRDRGITHQFVTWPGPVAVLARHLATRAAAPAFPQVVADLADVVEPLDDPLG